MVKLENIRLIVFFTRNVKVADWDRIGFLDREVAYYSALSNYLKDIRFVSYDDVRSARYKHKLKNIKWIYNRFSLTESRYQFYLTRILPLFWKQESTVVKSLQVRGSGVAMRAARFAKVKFVARCGHLPADTSIWRYGPSSEKTKKVMALERRIFEGANSVVVTTCAMKGTIEERYGIPESKVTVIPNYVDTERFRPFETKEAIEGDGRLIFVGRLEEKKNVRALIEAVSELPVHLHIVGTGSLESELKTVAEEKGANVTFYGNVDNHKLPFLLGQSDIFVLPSHLEHHPKALIEAMSCGLAVVGANSPGINNLIEDNRTGILCGTNAMDIREAIRKLLEDKELRRRLGRNARVEVETKYSKNAVMEKELTLLSGLVGRR